jgi:hypothetical protein
LKSAGGSHGVHNLFRVIFIYQSKGTKGKKHSNLLAFFVSLKETRKSGAQ